MKVKVHASKLVTPSYGGGTAPPAADAVVPLTVFDKVNFDTHVSVLYAFRPPAPPNAALEEALGRALAEHREWAGRLVAGPDGRHAAIALSDAGARLVEATAEATLASAMPFRPSPALLALHPRGDGAEELLLVQLTRFACGALVLGVTAHHLVSDGRGTSEFLLAWGQAARGVPLAPRPPPHARAALFSPRSPPRVEFEHRGAEFVARKPPAAAGSHPLRGEVVVQKTHFTRDFLTRLKATAAAGGADRPYSTFQCLVAHLWRAVTRARGLNGCEATRARIAVDGRARMAQPGGVPEGYQGNVVLWAFPRANARDLVTRPLHHAVELIQREVQKMNDAYFRSFIDFASSEAAAAEGLVSSADAAETVLCPDLEVDSWLRLPFYELDFGGGSPYFFMPTFLPVEGLVILLPSFFGDGSIDAYVPLFAHNVDTFKSCCYSLE